MIHELLRGLLLFVLGVTAWAHDAPANVTVHVQMRAAPGAMRTLVRIPMEAVRDVDFPQLPGGYLDVARLAPRLAGLAKIWVADLLVLYEDGAPTPPPRIIATQISIESDRSFASFDSAHARLQEELPPNEQRLIWKQVFFDVALEYPIRRADAAFAVRPGFADLGERVNTVLHHNGRTFLVPGEQAAFPLEPRWWEASWLFVKMGFVHILEGADHLLFLLCLVLPVQRVRALLWVVTAFTAAHSLTLAASAVGMAPEGLWFPPAVELAIAASIVVMALGNVVGWTGHGSWALAFAFGLVHGFGFSFALRESMQFAGGHLAAALLAFNVGVELGQLAGLMVMVALLRAWGLERVGVMVASALVAHTGWHWMWERGERLAKYSFPGLSLGAGELAAVLEFGMAAMVAYGVYRFMQRRRVGE